MKLFDKRNIVLIMSIFLLLMMVSSVSAADVSEDAVIGNDAAIDTITSTDTDSGSIDDVISAEVSDNPKANPSDSNESLSGEIVADASSNNDNSNENSVDDSSQDVLKASSDDEVLSADPATFDKTVYVSPTGSDTTGTGDRASPYATLQHALDQNGGYYAPDTLKIVLLDGTYSGIHSGGVYTTGYYATVSHTFDYLLICAENEGKATLDGLGRNKLLHISAPNVHIRGINFVNAHPTANSSGVCVSIDTNHVSIENCNFTNNGNNLIWGGAIHVQGNRHDINITNSYFENNTAEVGGCIRSENGAYDINFVNTTFIGNNATAHGGVGCLFGDQNHKISSFDNCYFENNTAPSSGAVHFHSGNSVVNNCTFVGNKAQGHGNEDEEGYAGALGLVYTNANGVTINNSKFYNNTASRDGGAVQIIGGGSNAKIFNSEFENNTATRYGGAVSIFGTNTTIDNASFIGNKAERETGGAIFISGNGTSINNATILNNTANTHGGGISITGGRGTSINDTEIGGNKAGSTSNGGGIYITGSNTRNITVNNSAIYNNTAQNGAGAFISGANVTVINSNVTENDASADGAGIYIGGANATVSNSNIANNTASGSGAGVYINGNYATVTNSNVTENEAGVNGSGVFIAGSTAKVANSTIANNTADGSGAGIYIRGANAVVADSTIANHTTQVSGAGIYIAGNAAIVNHTNITNNNATVNGGGAYIAGSQTRVINSTFEENNALPDESKIDDGLGGALFLSGNNNRVLDSNFTHNTARNGSAIYVNPTGTSGNNQINNCDFFENQAWVYWLPILYDNVTHKIETNLTGGNNILNAIYNNGSRDRLRINGVIPLDGWEAFVAQDNETYPYQDDLEYDQEIIITVYDRNGNVVAEFPITERTNRSGTVSITVPEADTSTWFIINMTHTEDPYYKHITNITAININPGVTVSNVTMYEGNESAQTVTVNVVDGTLPVANATINLTVIGPNGQVIELGYGKTSDEGVYQVAGTWFETFPPEEYKIQATCSYLYFNVTTGKNETKTVVGNGTLKVLPYEWNITKTIIAVNGQPYEEGMEIHVYDNITFNITVSNLVDADITSVKITDVNTDNLTYNSTESGSPWAYDGNNVWSLETLPANGNSSLIVTFLITNNGTSINVANASIFNDKENKSANVSFTAIDLVILDITKVANATEVYVGENVTFTITVTNNGQSNATNANVTDKLDPNFAWVSGGSYDEDSHTVTWNIGTIQPGADNAVSVEVVVTVLANGTFNNTAVVKCDENETETNNSTNITVKQVILDITKVANATEVYVGENVTFTITVTNVGDADATNANVTDKLDPNFTWVSGGSYDEDSHTVTWNIGTIEPGADNAVSVEVVVTVTANGTFNNTAVVKCDENETETNNSTNITVKQVILDITKVANATEVLVGDNITFTITVTNVGDGVGHNANVTDKLDPNFTWVSGGSYDEDSHTVTWNIGTIEPGADNAVSVEVVVTVTANGTFNNTAVVKCDENETETNNSTNITAKQVVLEITKDVNTTVVVIGEEVEFTIVVKNTGDATATNVVVVDELPEGFTAVDFTSPYTIDSLAPGANKTIKITAVAVKAGEWINVANVTCTENQTVKEANAKAVTVLRLNITISVGNYITTPGTEVPVEITVVDQRGNPVTINLTVVVTGPNATEDLPEHEGKLVFTITTDLGADGEQVEVTDGKGEYKYKVPVTATNGTSYNVTASSEENDQYAAAEGTGYIDVIQYSTTTTISDASGKPGETVTLDVEVTTEDGTPFNGDVVITCPDGKKVTVTVKDGKGQFDWTIPEDAKDGDEFKFTATFEGNSTYLASSGNGTVTVKEPEPPKPEPPVPEPEPEEPEEPVVTPAKMLNTGNPLVALLAAFVLIGLGLKRREEE